MLRISLLLNIEVIKQQLLIWGGTKTMTSNPSDPNAPPNPDFEIATKITANIVTKIKISGRLICAKPFSACSNK